MSRKSWTLFTKLGHRLIFSKVLNETLKTRLIFIDKFMFRCPILDFKLKQRKVFFLIFKLNFIQIIIIIINDKIIYWFYNLYIFMYFSFLLKLNSLHVFIFYYFIFQIYIIIMFYCTHLFIQK